MSLTNSLRRAYRKVRSRQPNHALAVELVNICNLHCAYCLRDESMLYGKAQFLEVSRLFGLLDSRPRDLKSLSVSLTGGEPLLHPQFGEVARGLHERKVPYKVVTNGWHFDRVFDDLRATRPTLAAVAFSLDGPTRAAHDAQRGDGSFDRLMKAVALCQGAKIPFGFNVVLRRDTFPQIERIAVFGARLGARSVNLGALLPTTLAVHREWGLSKDEELQARGEAAALTGILKIPVRVSFGLYDDAPGPHCPPLSGRSATLDYRGRLRLCGNLSSFRGGSGERDVVAQSEHLSLGEGWHALGVIGHASLRARDAALGKLAAEDGRPDPILGSPCLSCLGHFDKLDSGVRAELLARWSRKAPA